jgi:fatty-acyl-CoA synthase
LPATQNLAFIGDWRQTNAMAEVPRASNLLERTQSSKSAWLRALKLTAPLENNPTRIFPLVVEELAEQFRDKPALLSDHQNLTYSQLSSKANRYARWALAQGVRKGTVVCLLMPNRPEYMAIWVGISSVGGIVALLNTALSGKSLAHHINTALPDHIILAAELEKSFDSAQPHLVCGPKAWIHGDGLAELPRVDLEIDRFSDGTLNVSERRLVTLADSALYIYTSGTTGFPKAAKISHYRVLQWSYWFAGMMGTQPNDRMYDCLPMYHSVGGVVATGALLVSGGSVVLAERFSTKRFWDDVCAWNCTIFQYIGELCRYIVNAPFHPREAGHRLRLCCGNGLRADIWRKFKTRFKIPQMLEFYAATESNFALYNAEGVVGSIGRIPPFLAHRLPLALVRFDVENAEPIRNELGYCSRCASGEIGEAIVMVNGDAGRFADRFDGYTDDRETKKKILRNVFQQGDSWFRTGDLMRQDRKGYFYFVDRVGDTFRWKGENVSTTEVAEAITEFPGVVEAVVYGVQIPRTEGRAGMAALVANSNFDLTKFTAFLRARLPEYARPIFVRMAPEIDATPTFKQAKSSLIQQNYDPTVTADAVYVIDRGRQKFIRLNERLYRRILKGDVNV